ncbi:MULTISPECIES: transposase [unclassified Moraxella]|uniref:IS701 family transposase n=1 Tax=unclassified Moraxella TaxID=2685852 RepID=UPI003AF4A98C
MNREMIELYSDYLIASFGQTTATGLSHLLQGEIYHDSITRFLNGDTLTAKQQWQLVKPVLRQLENDNPDATGYLIFDDTIQPKPHSQENDTICWHYHHTVGRNVKGINLLNCLYHRSDINIPLSFDIVTKPNIIIDEKGKRKRKSDKTKNQRLIEMFDHAVKNQVKFDYVLADSWFSAKHTFKHIRKAKKHFIFALKTNRLVALSNDDRQQGQFVRITETAMPDNTPVRGFLHDYQDEVLLLRRVFTNKDGSTGILYLVCSDLDCDADTFMNGYQKRWHVEVYHKSLKQNANLGSSPAHSQTARHNHIFLAIYAVFKLECLKIKTKLNHFRLRYRLLLSASQSAFAELKLLKTA